MNYLPILPTRSRTSFTKSDNQPPSHWLPSSLTQPRPHPKPTTNPPTNHHVAQRWVSAICSSPAPPRHRVPHCEAGRLPYLSVSTLLRIYSVRPSWPESAAPRNTGLGGGEPTAHHCPLRPDAVQIRRRNGRGHGTWAGGFLVVVVGGAIG